MTTHLSAHGWDVIRRLDEMCNQHPTREGSRAILRNAHNAGLHRVPPALRWIAVAIAQVRGCAKHLSANQCVIDTAVREQLNRHQTALESVAEV